MASTDQNSNAVLQGLARHINCLSEENRNVRKRALEAIRNDTLDRKPPLDTEDLQPLFNELLKPLLKTLSDPVEKCRELSLIIISDFLKVVPNPTDSLPYLVPVLVMRLGQQEIVEPSEELRFNFIEVLNCQIVEYSGEKIAIYLDDLIRILQRTIIDPYPAVKRESCRCAAKVAKAIPQHFHMQSETLIKPLLLTITHQHSRVRTTTIETIGDVIQYGNGKSVDAVISHLAQRLFDDSPSVRKAVTKVVGNWLLDLPDRYSFHHKLMPLLLTSLSDSQPEIQELADTLWHDVGLKYEKENEEELKDKSDFSKEAPAHYPPNSVRPNLGCRTLMFRNMSKILPALMRDITDWVAATRIKSACLLYWLLLNCEDYITQHMTPLLNGMYKACNDDEKEVVKQVQDSAELIGYFVQPDVWCKMILSSIKLMQSFCPVMVLASVIKGSERAALKPYLPQIMETLTLPDICHTAQVQLHTQLLNCVEAIMEVSMEDTTDISQSVFDLLMSVQALRQNQETADKVHTLLNKLYKTQVLESSQQLFGRHAKPLVHSFGDSFGMWNVHSPERLIFDTLLIESGPVVGEILEDVMPVLLSNLHADKDPEVRLKFFSLLSRLIMNSSETIDSQHRFGDFALTVVKDAIIPNCVWTAGRTAAAIRTTAVSCMWALLQSGVLTQENIKPIVEDLLTQMISSMDDDNKSTRLISCRVLTRLFDLMGKSLDQDRLHNMYLDLLKRLDDSDDEIRITVSRTFLAFLDCFQDSYDVVLYRAHLDSIYKGLLVHLDDPDEKIQDSVLEVLKKAGRLDPGMLIQEVEAVKHKHRSQVYCNSVLEHAKGLLKSQS